MACRQTGNHTNLLMLMMAGLGAAWCQGHLPELPFAPQAGWSCEGQAELEMIPRRAEQEAAAETELAGSHLVTEFDSRPKSGSGPRCESDLEPRLDLEARTGAEHLLCWAVQMVMAHQQCLQLGWSGMEGSDGGMAACS